MIRGLVVATVLLALAGCTTGDDGVRTTGNVAEADAVAAPKRPHWVSGQLQVEPAARGRACLLLTTKGGTYVLRPAAGRLEAVVWHDDGSFDAARSGIADGRRIVAPYADEQVSVRGGVVAKSDPACGTHPTLGFTQVRRTGAAAPATGEPTAGRTLEGIPDGENAWTRGRLGVAPGRGDARCLVFATASGTYALTSGSDRYDLVVGLLSNGGTDRRRTGIHVTGGGALDMARIAGQQVELLGAVLRGTDYVECSRYRTFSMTDLR